MALSLSTWGRYMSLVLLYWVLVVGGWIFYTTRPSTQRRAREHAVVVARKDPVTGGTILTLSSTINLGPIAALLFAPPLALLIVWLVLRRQ